jgi:hypothetical protein
MTIARELVTRLSFAFDRTNLDKFEKAISNFKTKFDIAALTIRTAFNRIVDYAKDFSNKILKNDAIAKFTKTSVSDLTALQNAFQKFDVNPETFTNFFENLSIQIKEASRGVNNEFRTLVTQSNGAVRLMVNNQVTTSKQAVDDIRHYIQRFADESEQLRIIQNIFKVDLQTSSAIQALFKLTDDEFDKLIEKERISAEALAKNKEIAQQFKTQINQLETEWTKFSDKVASFAVPLATQAFGGLNLIAEKTQSEGILSSLKFVGEAIVDGVLTAFGEGHLQQVQRQVMEDDADFWRRLREQETARINNQNQSSITNNNRIEVNVPPTTDAQQGAIIAETVKASMNSFWDEKVREVINNNPQVE